MLALLTATTGPGSRTLFAGFAFSFVKMVCDCVFVASAMARVGAG